MYTNIQAIILAAGKSTRFNTGKTKLLEKICGQEMVIYLTKLLERCKIPTTVVVGYQKNELMECIRSYHNDNIRCITQEEQRGTGHALRCTQDQWNTTDLLVLNGDIPLITHDIIQQLYTLHRTTQATISFVIAHKADTSNCSYGRVIQNGSRIKIVEAADLQETVDDHHYINAGIYLINKTFLQEHIADLQRNNARNELYITDLIDIASDKQLTVTTSLAPFDYVRGINTFQELWAAEQIKKSELIKHWMDHGVYFATPQTTIIDVDVTIGAGSRIEGSVHLVQGTCIGKQCIIQTGSLLERTTLQDHVTIEPHCIIKESTIGAHSQIGPFAHIRNKTHIDAHNTIGNFVEIKNSTLGTHTKAKHLAYLGDARIGSHVNIGAGTITCNHDGTRKHETTIHDHAYIGSNSTLIAPITIGLRAFTAAGSVITHNVPADALAIARQRQINKEGYALKLRTLPDTNTSQNIHFDDEPNKGTLSFIGARRVMHDDTTPEEL